MKNMPDTPMSRVYKYLLSEQWFYTVSGTFLQTKSANLLGWNIFLIQGLSMLASPQIQTVNLPIKSQAFLTSRLLCVGVALNVNSFGRTVSQHSPDRTASKACCLAWFIRKIPKILCVFGTLLWNRTFYRHNDLSTTCQCRQLKLNLLSTGINFYCLMTNQTPALLVQRAPCTVNAGRSDVITVPLFFSPPPPRAIMPDARPLGTVHLKIKMSAINGKTRYIMTISRKNSGGTVNSLDF